MSVERDLAVRNDRGVDAWSPSRAREALRRVICRDIRASRNRSGEYHDLLMLAESDGSLSRQQHFDGFCMMELGQLLDL